MIRIGSRTFVGSWVEFMKSSILDLVGLLDPPLFNIMIL